jgi:hypothetical protein
MPFEYSDGGCTVQGETRDCTVRAIALAADMPYADAHALLRQAGRRNGRKFPFRIFMRLCTTLGYYRVHDCTEVVKASTVGQFLKKNLPGRFMVLIRGHVFAVIDGTVRDKFLAGARHRIKRIWFLERIPS